MALGYERSAQSSSAGVKYVVRTPLDRTLVEYGCLVEAKSAPKLLLYVL